MPPIYCGRGKAHRPGRYRKYRGGEALLIRAGGASASAAAADAVIKHKNLAVRCVSAWGQYRSAV